MKYNLFRFVSLFMISSELHEVDYEDILLLQEEDVNWSETTVTIGSDRFEITPETMRFLGALRTVKPKGQQYLFIN